MTNLSKTQIREYLLNNISLESLQEIELQLTVNKELFEKFFQILKGNEDKISWRAAWAIWHIFKDRKDILDQYIDEITNLLPHFPYDGQKREMLKILLLYKVKDLNISSLLNTAFDFLVNPNESLAVKVHSMQLLYYISEVEPDIKAELISTIEFVMPDSSIGFKNRGGKLLRRLREDIAMGNSNHII